MRKLCDSARITENPEAIHLGEKPLFVQVRWKDSLCERTRISECCHAKVAASGRAAASNTALYLCANPSPVKKTFLANMAF